MNRLDRKHDCEATRRGLAEAILGRIVPTGWMERHMANCPRCRRKALAVGRVDLALMLLRTQAHTWDLLRKANRQAVAALGHVLREEPRALQLRNVTLQPTLRERMGRYSQPLTNALACLAVLVLLRTGIYSAATRVHEGGQQALEQRYAQLDSDIREQIL